MPNWQLYQYRVDFQPEEDRNAVKKEMVRHHKEELGGYLFDGTVLFSSKKYNSDVSVVYLIFIHKKKKNSALWHPCQFVHQTVIPCFSLWSLSRIGPQMVPQCVSQFEQWVLLHLAITTMGTSSTF